MSDRHTLQLLWAGFGSVAVGILGLFLISPEQGADAKAPVASSASQRCSAFHAGQDNVIRTFCDGPAILTIILNGTPRTVRGGSCEITGDMQAFNVGVVMMGSGTAPKPDYVGMTADHGKLTALGLHLDGVSYVLTSKTGEISNMGGAFAAQGHSVDANQKPVSVTAKFTCH